MEIRITLQGSKSRIKVNLPICPVSSDLLKIRVFKNGLLDMESELTYHQFGLLCSGAAKSLANFYRRYDSVATKEDGAEFNYQLFVDKEGDVSGDEISYLTSAAWTVAFIINRAVPLRKPKSTRSDLLT